MIIDKVIKKLAKNISANKNIRESLNGVFFTENKAVATDSHKMVEITYHKEESIKESKMISQEDIKNNLINISKLDTMEKGKFMDYKHFYEKHGTYSEVKFNPQYMIDIMEVYKSLGCREVHMEINGMEPILLSGGDTYQEIEIKSILMPIKI